MEQSDYGKIIKKYAKNENGPKNSLQIAFLSVAQPYKTGNTAQQRQIRALFIF